MNEDLKRIYLDYTATTPMDPEILDAMMPYLTGYDANPNSLYTSGRKAHGVLEDCRARVARSLGAEQPAEIVFTSGGTESDNAALFGLARATRDQKRKRVVISAIEHHAVLETAQRLRSVGYTMTEVAPRRDGLVHVDDFEAALQGDDVCVASVMSVNNETGAIQPVHELAGIAHEHGARFHCDAVQALGKLPVNLEESGVDSAAFSLHKVGGPKGVGVLYLRRGVPFATQMTGGGQESGRRSGTQNVAGAAACAFACEKVAEGLAVSTAMVEELRSSLEDGLRGIPGVQLTVDRATNPEVYVPHICSILVDGLESETLILHLDARGFEVSAGSACSSTSLDPSHVLKAMGISDDLAYGSLRISLGHDTRKPDIEAFIAALSEIVSKMR